MKRIERIVEQVYRVRLGWVNAFLIARPEQLTLVDCGRPGQAHLIGQAIEQLGFSWGDLRHILVTHCHPDHTGSLAAVQKLAPQATTYMGPIDAALVREGIAVPVERPLRPAPGLHHALLFHALVRTVPRYVDPARVDREVFDGQRLEIAGGVTALYTPGHTLGHVSYLWHARGGVMFAGDVAASIWGLGYSLAYEDFERGQQTIAELVEHPSECICFGHGKAVLRRGDPQWLRPLLSRSLPTGLAPAES